MTAYQRAKKAITDRFRELYPRVKMEREDAVWKLENNLREIQWMGGRDVGSALAFFRAGDGDKLKARGKQLPELHVVHSSSALAVNTFAPWLRQPLDMLLTEKRHFRTLEFERQVGVASMGRPAVLDVFASGFEGVVGVECAFLEPFQKRARTTPFAPQYHYFRDKPNCRIWYDQVVKLNSFPEKFRYLDARKLVSQALGLIAHYGPAPVNLLYLFWEPENWQGMEEFLGHRLEIQAFTDEIKGSSVSLVAQSYADLLASWGGYMRIDWVRKHVAGLAQRYLLRI
ncbi:MAG: hypothetical protein JSV00_07345 [bacterium]|nr:MAG: hypothetical protein JSV00_07345 [bacterium]